MSSFPATQPQRFGVTWSSICIAAAPAWMRSRVVRVAMTAFPYAVSASTITGTLTALTMRRAAIMVSLEVTRPASGTPNTVPAVPPPDR
jgi:hypothetical protein